MAMQEAAYDLSTFENRAERAPRNLRVAQTANKSRRRRDLSGLKIIALCAVVLALSWGVLYSRAQVTELSAAIESGQKELAESKSEYDYLSLTLESKVNMQKVEEVAKQQLGLLPIDKNQITYITLESEDKIVKPQGEVKTLLSDFESGFLNLMEYIAP
ncbi:MAG: hypothetical protein RSF90_05290 [Pygmaiobacter sp.]